MATNFTTWQDLYVSMLNSYADFIATGRFQIISYGIAGRNMTYRSRDEFQQGLEDTKFMADHEQGRAVGRTLAKPIGRNKWSDRRGDSWRDDIY